MKILSYNINGINAFYNNGKLHQLFDYIRDADIYCFQETKGDNIKVDSILNKAGLGSKFVWYECHNTWKKGYAGVVTLVRKDLKSSILSVESPQLLPEYGEGRIVTLEFTDYYLVNVYVLNSGNKDELRMTFDQLFREYIEGLDKPVVIVGDMNVCHKEEDYWGPWQRVINSCAGLMQYEIDGFDRLLRHCQLTDTYRLCNGKEPQFTWYSNRDKWLTHGWRIDYALVSKQLEDRVLGSFIWEKFQAPDHSPIELVIE